MRKIRDSAALMKLFLSKKGSLMDSMHNVLSYLIETGIHIVAIRNLIFIS